MLDETEPVPSWMPAGYARKLKRTGIPASLRRHPVIFQTLLRAGRALPSSFSANDYQHRLFHAFDRWIAGHIGKLRPKVVIAYENSAYHTFQAAKRIGAHCILDAPSLHYKEGQKLMNSQSTPYLAEINQRKAAEVELADLILTCSPLAAESYTKHGAPEAKVRPMLLGATLPDDINLSPQQTPPYRFVFAGALSHRKSIDIILSAFKKLHEQSIPFQLHFIGGEAEQGWVTKINNAPATTYHGNIPQHDLYRVLASSSCLLLPSRFDSFGMVVAEAMACGTPAIVSTQVGAKAIIEEFPGAGWIISPEADALHECVKNLIKTPAHLASARAVALTAAREFTWRAYRQRVGLFIEHWMQEHA